MSYGCELYITGDKTTRQIPAYLVSECVEELDSVNSKDRMNAAFGGLQVGKDVLAKEGNDINEDIGRSHTKLDTSAVAGRTLEHSLPVELNLLRRLK